MSAPPPELEERVATLQRAIRSEREAEAQLASARRDADASVALRTMFTTLVVFIALGLGVFLFAGPDRARDPLSVAERWLLVLGVSSLVAWVGRRTLLATALARRLTGLFTAIFVAGASSAIASAALGETDHQAGVHAFLACGGMTAAGALALLPELWLSVAVLLSAALASGLVPAEMRAIQIVAVALDVLVVAWALHRHALRVRDQGRVRDAQRASVRPPA